MCYINKVKERRAEVQIKLGAAVQLSIRLVRIILNSTRVA